MSNASTGRPTASASSADRPKVSLRDGMTTSCASASIRHLASPCTSPTRRTQSSKASRRICAFSCSLPRPSPMTVSSVEPEGRTASASSSRSRPLDGISSRPRNTLDRETGTAGPPRSGGETPIPLTSISARGLIDFSWLAKSSVKAIMCVKRRVPQRSTISVDQPGRRYSAAFSTAKNHCTLAQVGRPDQAGTPKLENGGANSSTIRSYECRALASTTTRGRDAKYESRLRTYEPPLPT